MSKGIIIIITDITGAGGTERTSCNLASTFVSKGHKTTIISLFKQRDEIRFNISPDVNIEYISECPYSLSLGVFGRVKRILSIISKLKCSLKGKVNCLIISQVFLPSLLVWISGFAKQTIVCEHFKYKIYNKIVCRFRDFVYSKFKRLVLLTNNEEKLYAKTIQNISIIPNMVLPHNIHANITSNKIIAAGRLSYEKGFDLLIEAAQLMRLSCPNHTVHIYGSGELKDQLSESIKDKNLMDYVYIEDFTNNIIKVMSQSSIYVLSSRFEGLPMVMLEAMSIGMPVVSFNCPTGPADLLKNGAGVLVEPENPKALAAALIKVANDATLRQELATKAKRKAEQYCPNNIYSLWSPIINCNN